MKLPGDHSPAPFRFARRSFLAAAGVAPVAGLLAAPPPRPVTQASVPEDPAAPREQVGTVPASSPFDEPLAFARKDFALRVKPFPLAQVRLLPGPFLKAQEANRALLHRYDADRLL